MKRHLCTALLLAALCTGWFSCRTDDEWREPSQRRACLSVEEARKAYDRICERTRSTEEETGVLHPGETTVYWDGAAYSENSYAASYDVPIWTEQGFQIIRSEDGCGDFDDLIFPKLVVVSEREAPETATPYLAFYFADPDPNRDGEPVAGSGLLNSLPKTDFSGRIVYTELTGQPVAAARYIEGRQTERAFLYDARDSLSFVTIADRYNRIVEDIRIHLYIPEANTRSNKGQENDGDNSDPTDGGTIPTVVVTCKPINFPVYIPTINWQTVRPDPSLGASPGGGGGWGGGANGPGRDGFYRNSKLRTDSEIVDRMLDSIYEDCMGKTLIDALDHNITITTDSDRNGIKSDLIFFAEGKAGARNRSFVLLEELIHAYQHQNLSPVDCKKRKLNLEIEAKAGWMMYEKRKSGNFFFTPNQFNRQLGHKKGTIDFQDLCDNVYPDYDKNNWFHASLYEDAIASLRTIRAYKDETNYPESEEDRNFDLLKELMKNCQEL